MVVCRWASQQWLVCGDPQQASVSAWQARLLAAGRGCCFPARTALQPHYGLPEFWFDRYENNFKNHTTVYSKPRADGFVLFDRKGQRNHNSTAAKGQVVQSVLCTQNGETLSDRGAGEPRGPLVGGRIRSHLIFVFLKAWDWLLQKVCGGLDHLVGSNVVHGVSGLL